MTTDFNALRESVADIASQVGKLQQQMVDLRNTFKASQVPAAPPPGNGPGGGIGGVPGPGAIPAVRAPDLLGKPYTKMPIETAMAGMTTSLCRNTAII